MKKIILIFLPLLALACGFSRSALIEPFPTQPNLLPSPTAPQAETRPPSPTHPQPTRVCTVAVANLHLRESAGLQGVVIGWLKAGQTLTILDDQPEGDWIRVRSGDLTGWINSNYCYFKVNN